MATYRKRHARHRRRGKNPGGATGTFTKSLTAGFSVPAVKTTGLMAVGAVANVLIAMKIGQAVPFLNSKITNPLVGIATAGAMLMIPKVGKDLFAGAMTGTLVKTVKDTGALKAYGMGELYTGDARAQLRELILRDGNLAELDRSSY